jgi:hypothetical protein
MRNETRNGTNEIYQNKTKRNETKQNLDKLAEWESKWLMKFHPEGFFFDRFVRDVYVPFKKTDVVVGFRADGAYTFTPFEV